MQPEPALRHVPRRVLAHIGVSVPDLDLAVAWYQRVLGFELMAGPLTIRREDGHSGAVAADVFGERFGSLRQAHLSGANATGLELFEFIEPKAVARPEAFQYWQTGFTHICVVERDSEGLVELIRRSGGGLHSRQVWELFPGEPFQMAYCRDPFGNLIEVYSHGYERTYANRPL